MEDVGEGGEAITVERLSKTSGPLTALDDVSFRVPPQTVFGLLGPNCVGGAVGLGGGLWSGRGGQAGRPNPPREPAVSGLTAVLPTATDVVPH